MDNSHFPVVYSTYCGGFGEIGAKVVSQAKGVCSAVKDYRLYFLDGFSGHIDEVEEFDAEGDEEAVAAALGKSNGRPMELWHRHHKLRHWDAALPSLD